VFGVMYRFSDEFQRLCHNLLSIQEQVLGLAQKRE
jgi:hypothetical protein